MRPIATLVLSCSLCGVPVFGLADDSRPQLDDRLEAALGDIRHRDPGAFEAIQAALRQNPRRARERLAHHAQYLEELAAAKAAHPEKFHLMMEQEAKERQVRELIEQFHLVAPEADEHRALVDELRGELEVWFEIRQALRSFEIERFAASFAEQMQEFEAAAEDFEGAREEWLDRIVAGGPQKMQMRLEHLAQQDDVEPLAPAMLHLIMRKNPEMGRILARLSEESPPAFLEALRQIAQEHPVLFDEAQRISEDEIESHRTLQLAVRDAHVLLIPLVRGVLERDTIQIPADRQDEVAAVLKAIVEVELAITRSNLANAEKELRQNRDIIEYRRQHKDIIVDLQLSRLLGQSDRYKW